MLRSLTIDNAGTPGADLCVKDVSSSILGRAPFADMALPEHSAVRGLISRRHASVELQGENLVITDLGSLNGTWYEAPGQHEQLYRLVPHIPQMLEPGSTVYFGGQKRLMDRRGAIAPNPYAYIYLGTCHRSGQQQQEQATVAQPGGTSVLQFLEPQQQRKSDKQQLLCKGQHTARQQQHKQELISQQKQGNLISSDTLHQQLEQQHKRRRLADFQRPLQAPIMPADVHQCLLDAKSAHPSCSGTAGSTVEEVQQCQSVQQQEHQLLLYRQQRQQHYEQQQAQHRYEVPQQSAHEHQLPHPTALAELDINRPSLPACASGLQKLVRNSEDTAQRVHTMGGAAGPPDAANQLTTPGTGVAAAEAKTGSPQQLGKASQRKCKEQGKDMRKVSSSHLDCAVCKDLLAAAHALSCGHMFCGVCLAQWLELKQAPSCPSCRAAVTSVPVRLFTMDDIVAEAQFSQGSECQERAARLQQWGEIKDTTLEHWQQRFQQDNNSSRRDDRRAGRSGSGAAQQQAHPHMLAGVVPFLAAARQDGATAARQAAVAARQLTDGQGQRQHRSSGRQGQQQQQPGTGRRSAAAAPGGTGSNNTAGRRAASRRHGRNGQGKHASRAQPQQGVVARQPAQQQGVELPRNLRQIGINAFVTGAVDAVRQ